MLADGGVYDNLGLETAWKAFTTVLVSDGGGHMGDQPHPKHNWPHAGLPCPRRDRQPGAQPAQASADRRLQRRRSAKGAYWGVRSDIADYDLATSLPCPVDATMKLAGVSTRLAALKPRSQEQLINWGYAISDTGSAQARRAEPRSPAGLPVSRTRGSRDPTSDLGIKSPLLYRLS